MKIIQQFLKRFGDARDVPLDLRKSGARAAVTPAPLLMALEPRVVYDASVAAIAPHHAHGAEADTHAGAATATSATVHAAPKTVAEHDVRHVKPLNDNDAQTTDTQKAVQSGAAAAADAASHAVVFIDPSVPNYQALIAGLPAGTQYVVLNATTDGFAQIADYLQTHKGVDSIHLISHGTDGEIQAGSTWLNAGDLAAYSGELAQIGAAMKPGGDFLIYGCDVAQNADGQMLVQQVAALTHLNVAASTDATGASALGGNWTLEYQVGAVHTQVIESAAAQLQFNALLGVTVENYDAQAAGGYQNTSATFTLDGITYVTDATGGIENDIYTTTTDPFGSPDLSSGPGDGTLMLNFNGDQMSQVTIELANGAHFSLSSFDLDAVSDGKIYLIPNGDTSKEVLIFTGPGDGTGGTFTGTVSLSGNANFANLTSFTIVDVGDDPGANFVPSLDNLTYTVLAPTLTPSSGSAAFTAADNATSTPVLVDSGLTFTDSNATTAQSATVAIGNLKTGDVLAFTSNSATMGDITGTYNATTGVLSLSSSSHATLAQWQTALDSVTFTNSQITPDATTRTINFSVTDSSGATGTATRSLTVTDTDQTPIVTTTGGTTGYVAGGSATTIDSGVTVSDRDNTTLPSATIQISSGAGSGDTLSFTNDGSTMGNITAGTYNASTHVLTLTSSGGTATDAQWQSALDHITFSSDAGTTDGARTISFVISDGAKSSVTTTKTVDVAAVPIVTVDSGSASFVSGDNTASTPVTIDSGLTVTESGHTTLASATVAITGGFQSGEDSLLFSSNASTMGNISGTYDASTGILSLSSASGTATLAQWQAALRSITYTDSAITPNTATRTISFTANDGTNSSATVTRAVTVADTDQTPIVTLSGSNTAYVAGSTATVIDGGISVTDRDTNPTLAAATVSITGGFQTGDTLSFVNDSFVTGSYNATTGTLSLSANGSVSDAQWQIELDKVSFSTAASAPGGVRTVSFVVNDGTNNSAGVSRTVTVAVAPIVTTDSGSAAFVAGDNTASTPVAVDSGLTVTENGHTTLASGTVSITGNFHAGEDSLLFSNNVATMGNISGTYDASTGVLSLSSAGGTATLAQWQAALRSITYTDSAITPDIATRTISFTVNDGTNGSPTATRTVTVTDTDQTPIVTLSGSNTAYVAGSAATVIDGGISVTDRDTSPTLASATVSIGAGFQAGDTLSFTNDSFVTGAYNATTGVLTLSATGSVSDTQWQTELDNVRFASAAGAVGGVRTVSYAVNDGTKTSAVVSRTVTVTAVPVVTTDSGSAAFVAGDNAASTSVAVDSGLTVTDNGSTTLASGTVAITGNFHAGEDSLLFSNNAATMGNISGTYDASTGVLSLSSAGGTATLAQWQAALRSVTYTDSAITPDNATRTISFTVNDSAQSSPTATRTVTVTDTDQTPLLTTSSGSSAFVEGDNVTSTPVTVDAAVTVSDLDNSTLASATVSITGNFHSGQDLLAFTNTNASLFGDITSSYSAISGVLTMSSASGTATLAQWQAALRSVTYTDSVTSPDTSTRTISFTVSDGTKDSAVGTKDVTVTGTDQSPVLTSTTSGFDYLPGNSPHSIDSGVTLTDSDNTTMASVTLQFTAGFQSGDQLILNYNAATMGTGFTASYDASTGVFTISSGGGTLTLANWQAIIEGMQFSAQAGTPLGTRTLSITTSDGTKDSNTLSYSIDVISSAPQLSTTSTGSAAFTAGDNTTSTPVAVDSGISVSDPLGNPIVSATVAIGGNFHAGEDVLSYTNDGATMGDITGSFNATTGVLTLISAGGASDGQWDAALRSVTYTDTVVRPDTATRQVGFTISDGTQSSTALSRNVTVADVDQTPILTTSGGAASYVEGDNVTSTVAIDPGLTVSDLDNATLASATVSITSGFHAGEDALAFANTDASTFGNIAGSYDASTGVMTLTSSGNSATVAQWQAALRAVTYADTAVTPDTTQRVISFTVNDGTQDSAVGTRAVDLTATEQSPVVTTTSGDASFVSGDNTTSVPIVIDSGVTVSDLDNATLVSGSVSITSGFHAGEDVLTFANNNATGFGNITGSYDASTGVMTLSSAGGTASVAQWQAALQSITYTDTAIVPDGAARTISFTVNDGTRDSVTSTRVIDLTATTQTPTLVAGTGDAPTFTASGAGATPVTIDTGISITDRDTSAHPGSARVSISSGFQAGRDVLAFNGSTATGDIGASYDANTGVLTLSSVSGTATLAQWQAALAAVTYADTSAETSGSSRTISFALNVGNTSSVALSRTVNVEAGPVTVSPPATQQPDPPTPITLPSPSPFIGGGTAPATTNRPPAASAPDTIPTFPTDLGDSISNPLIVLDAFADAPQIGAIPTMHTATFSTGDFGELGASNGSGAGGGTHWHGSLSETSVESMQAIPAPEATRVSIDLPSQALEINAAPNQSFTISLPVMIGAEGLPAGADTHVELRLADGRPLPGWLHFDPVHGTLSGKVPANQRDLQIAIVAHDAAGHQTRREVAIGLRRPSGPRRPHARARGQRAACRAARCIAACKAVSCRTVRSRARHAARRPTHGRARRSGPFRAPRGRDRRPRQRMNPTLFHHSNNFAKERRRSEHLDRSGAYTASRAAGAVACRDLAVGLRDQTHTVHRCRTHADRADRPHLDVRAAAAGDRPDHARRSDGARDPLQPRSSAEDDGGGARAEATRLVELRPAAEADRAGGLHDAQSSARVVVDQCVHHEQSLAPSYSTDKNDRTADLSFSWNLLDFGVSYFEAKEQADHVLVLEQRRRKVVQLMMQQVREAYWQATGAQRLRERIGPLLDQAGSALNDSRQAQHENLRAPLDTLNYQHALLDLMRQLEEIRDQLEEAKPRLASLMNLEPGKDYTLAPPQDFASPSFDMPMEQMEETALERRPELVEASYNERISVNETIRRWRRCCRGSSSPRHALRQQ